MDTPASEVLVPLIVFSALFGIVYIAVTAKHRQRMAMIEKGLMSAEPTKRTDPFQSLKMGMVGIGVGVGLLSGYFFQTYGMIDGEDNPLPYFVMVAIFGGLALIWHFFIVQRKQRG
ncbi:MAG: DUF6249 domain-containing protein [Flavobacteriales bacterium]|jgi:hypothetical protein|nr:hypothetical protein [Flavobacteriales bacterium]